MTEDQFLDAVGQREGLEYAEPPAIDQPTGPYGITLPVLSAYRARPCTIADLRALTPADAREIVRANVRNDLQKLGFNKIAFEPLRWQCLDYAWNSGEERAIRWLQRTVGVPEGFVTGVMDDRTIRSLNVISSLPGGLIRAINNALAGERAHAALNAGTAPKFADGVAKRAISFVIRLDEVTET
jgi:lysozyme family protein